jgi:hypothetical protein
MAPAKAVQSAPPLRSCLCWLGRKKTAGRQLWKFASGSLDHFKGEVLEVGWGQSDLTHQRQKPRLMYR